MIELIVLGYEGTIVPAEGEARLRSGAREFLEAHAHLRIAVCSQKPRATLEQEMEQLGVFSCHPHVKAYGYEDMKRIITDTDLPQGLSLEEGARYAAEVVTGERSPESFSLQPDLRLIARESCPLQWKEALERTAVVSASPWDIEEASWENVRAFEVPAYLTADEDLFDFSGTDVGDWRNELRFAAQKYLLGEPRLIRKG